MAHPYAYNVIPPSGVALIAQATAANPLVYVDVRSKAAAASSDEDLAQKALSWYDGKTGEIAAVSAAGNVARPVGVWHASGSRQPALSLCITARLASQTDADAVVVAAMSDPDSVVVLPSADDVGLSVGVPFPIAIFAADTVTTTPGGWAALSDLKRFVSLHRAGNPTLGDAQTVLGEKTFSQRATFSNGASFGSSPSGGTRVGWNGSDAVETGTVICGELSARSEYINFLSPITCEDGHDMGTADQRWGVLYCLRVDCGDSVSAVSVEASSFLQSDGSVLIDDAGIETSNLRVDYIYPRSDGAGGNILVSASLLPGAASLSLGSPADSWVSLYANAVYTAAISPSIGDHVTVPSLVPSASGARLGTSASRFASMSSDNVFIGQSQFQLYEASWGGLGIGATISPAGGGMSCGTLAHPWSDVVGTRLIGDLDGRIPSPTTPAVDPPVGSIFLGVIGLAQGSYQSRLDVGEDVVVQNGAIIGRAGLTTLCVGGFARGGSQSDPLIGVSDPSRDIYAGTYRTLSYGDAQGTAFILALFLRVR